MKKILITSDTHLCHIQPFLFEPRGFSSIEEHDAAIVENWNAEVRPEDEVWHLGDMVMSDPKAGVEYVRQLNGHINLILGNHDGTTKQALYRDLPNVTIRGYADVLRYCKYNFFLSHYPMLTGNYDAEKPLRARVISLCGHSHTQDRWANWDSGLIYHCELDAHNNKPILLDQIIEEIKEKINNES